MSGQAASYSDRPQPQPPLRQERCQDPVSPRQGRSRRGQFVIRRQCLTQSPTPGSVSGGGQGRGSWRGAADREALLLDPATRVLLLPLPDLLPEGPRPDALLVLQQGPVLQ